MPASLDVVGTALQHSISSVRKKPDIDTKSLANTKRVLESEIRYVKAPIRGNPNQTVLKSNYIKLNAQPVLVQDKPVPVWWSPTKDTKHELPQPKKILYPADSVQLGWKGSVPIGAGFINLGNTCYLNSTLQALLHVPAFVNWLTNDTAHFSKCESMNGITHSECLICAMSKILQASHKSTGSAIKPIGIYTKLRSICKHLQHGHQEDAHEFLRYLIEGMERSYLSIFNGIKLDSYSKETTPLNQIFGGYMRTEVACLECHHISTTFQHFQDIILDIRQASTVEEALEGYFSREQLGDGDQAYKCEQCKRRVAATKKFAVERLPKVLCIQLKRFGAMGGKNTKHISLKQTLDINKYRHRPPPNQTFQYKLVSLVTHLGHSSSCGHYTAVGQSSAGTYYLFDDSNVKTLSTTSVLSSNAYILMYELDNQSKNNARGSLTNGLSNGSSQKTSISNGSISNNIQGKVFEKSLFKQLALDKNGRSEPSRSASPNKIVPLPQITKTPVKAKSLVPYLSSDSDCGSPPRSIEPVIPQVNSREASPESSKQNNLIKEKNRNGHKDDTLSVNEEKNSLKPKEEKTLDSTHARPDVSPAGSSLSGVWSVTSTEDKTSDKEDRLNGDKDRNKERYREKDRTSDKERSSDSKNNTVDVLLKMSHRGYGSSVNSWNGSKSELNKEVESERISLKRSLSFSNYDNDFDRGKVKKIKTHNGHDRDRKERHSFQEHQNRKNSFSGIAQSQRQQFYHSYTSSKSNQSCRNNNRRWNSS